MISAVYSATASKCTPTIELSSYIIYIQPRYNIVGISSVVTIVVYDHYILLNKYVVTRNKNY